MKLLLFTDAWFPQINGVVRALSNTVKQLELMGYEVLVVEPSLFSNIPCPLYPEIRLAFPKAKALNRIIDEFKPDSLHIATEGPIGLRARSVLNRRELNYTTSFHTLFPEYLRKMILFPERPGWSFLRWFHSTSSAVMVPTPSIQEKLEKLGFSNLQIWGRGIDLEHFSPMEREQEGHKLPIYMYVGRVSKEKNIEAFLKLDLNGTKIVVGDGPQRKSLEREWKDTQFWGYRTGPDLARAYSQADVMVFPSRTDTFGNVILESLACGTPVAAFPVHGPKDILVDSRLGSCNKELATAINEALLRGNREYCSTYAAGFTWNNSTEVFSNLLVPSQSMRSKQTVLAS